MTELERFTLWMLYAGALAARRRREHARVVRTLSWERDLALVGNALAAVGMTL